MSKYPVDVGPIAREGVVNVVIETPSGSRAKYAWNPAARAFSLSKLLPLGMAFPYDFGFLPRTKGGDGDPLDVLVLSEVPLVVGALVECRVLGGLGISTSEPGEAHLVQNDRLIVVPCASLRGESWTTFTDLEPHLIDEIVAFFRTYTQREGRAFQLVGMLSREKALALVKAAT